MTRLSRYKSNKGHRRERFDRVIATFHRDMYGYAVWLCRDKALAEDVVQEALLRAWHSLDSLRKDDAAKSWLLTIVRREYARYFSRKRLATVDIDNLTGSESAILATSDNLDIDSVRQAIFELDDGYREPLVLQVLIGHNTKEIAKLMSRSQGAVLTRLHRARRRLKATIDRDSRDWVESHDPAAGFVPDRPANVHSPAVLAG